MHMSECPDETGIQLDKSSAARLTDSTPMIDVYYSTCYMHMHTNHYIVKQCDSMLFYGCVLPGNN